jgi:hypothetical protein
VQERERQRAVSGVGRAGPPKLSQTQQQPTHGAGAAGALQWQSISGGRGTGERLVRLASKTWATSQNEPREPRETVGGKVGESCGAGSPSILGMDRAQREIGGGTGVGYSRQVVAAQRERMKEWNVKKKKKANERSSKKG